MANVSIFDHYCSTISGLVAFWCKKALQSSHEKDVKQKFPELGTAIAVVLINFSKLQVHSAESGKLTRLENQT